MRPASIIPGWTMNFNENEIAGPPYLSQVAGGPAATPLVSYAQRIAIKGVYDTKGARILTLLARIFAARFYCIFDPVGRL